MVSPPVSSNGTTSNGALQASNGATNGHNGNPSQQHSLNNNNNNNSITMTNSNKNSSLQQQSPQQASISWNPAVDEWWDSLMANAESECEPVWMDAEDPLFILYTR